MHYEFHNVKQWFHSLVMFFTLELVILALYLNKLSINTGVERVKYVTMLIPLTTQSHMYIQRQTRGEVKQLAGKFDQY